MGNLSKILSVRCKLIDFRLFFFFFVFFPFLSYSASISIWSSKCGLSETDAQNWLSGAQVVCAAANGGGSTFEGHVTTDKLNDDFTWTYCAKYRCDGCTSNEVKQDSIDLVGDCKEQCLGINAICSSTGLASYKYNIWDCSETPLTTGTCAESSSSIIASSSSVVISSSSVALPGSSSSGQSGGSSASGDNNFSTHTCYGTSESGCTPSTPKIYVTSLPSQSNLSVSSVYCSNGYVFAQTNIKLWRKNTGNTVMCFNSDCSASHAFNQVDYIASNILSVYCNSSKCFYQFAGESGDPLLPSNVTASSIWNLVVSAVGSTYGISYLNFFENSCAHDEMSSPSPISSGSGGGTGTSSGSGSGGGTGTSSGSGGGTGTSSGSGSGGGSSGSGGGIDAGDSPSGDSDGSTWNSDDYDYPNPTEEEGLEEDSPWAWRSDVWNLQKSLNKGFNMIEKATTVVISQIDQMQDSLYSYDRQKANQLNAILEKIPDSLKTTASASQDSAWHSFQAWAAQSLSASSTETYGDSLGDYNDSLVRELITNGIYNDSVYNAKIDSALRGLGFSLGDCNDLVGGSNNLGTGLLCGGLGNGEFAFYMRTVNTSIQEITGRMGSVNSQLNGIQNAIDHIPKSDTGVIDAVTDLAIQSASEHNGSVNAINSNGTSIRSQIEASSQALIDAYGENTGDIIGTLEKWGDSMTQAINGIEGGDSLGTGDDTITVAGGGIASDGEGYGSDYDGDGAADALDTTGTGVPASFYDSALGTDATHLAAVQAVGDSAKAFATSLRTATDMPFTDADAYCPTSLSLNPCEVLNGDCTMDVCDTRFNLAGHHLFYWMGVCIEFGAWVMFFMGIKLTRES